MTGASKSPDDLVDAIELYCNYIERSAPRETVITTKMATVPGAKCKLWQAELLLFVKSMRHGKFGHFPERLEYYDPMIRKIESGIELSTEEWIGRDGADWVIAPNIRHLLGMYRYYVQHRDPFWT